VWQIDRPKYEAPSWAHTQRICECLVIAANVLTRGGPVSNELVELAGEYLAEAEHVFDQERLYGTWAVDHLSAERRGVAPAQGIAARLERARNLQFHQPGTAIALTQDVLRDLEAVARPRAQTWPGTFKITSRADKGGTGRSVTSCNVLFQMALSGHDTCYVDFDFGSPTAGAIFAADAVARGTPNHDGLHSYLLGHAIEPRTWDLWTASDRTNPGVRPPGAGRMVLLPGDVGGGEFGIDREMVDRCGQLFRRLREEFALSIVDLSAGRSYATQLALSATVSMAPAVDSGRWLVFHRWTQQHLVAANGLIYGERGILDTAQNLGHDQQALLDQLRVVRTAVVDPATADLSGLRPSQLSWLRERHQELQRLAGELRLGRNMTLGTIPMDAILHAHEQLLTDRDVYTRQVANTETVEAFHKLAKALFDDAAWDRL
jgi:hypothetical protein